MRFRGRESRVKMAKPVYHASHGISLQGWGIEQQLRALRHGCAWLRRTGIRYSTNNRFEQYTQILSSSLVGPLDLGGRRRVNDALRGAMEVYFIARAFESSTVTPPTELVERMLSGRAGGQLGQQSTPWTAQHELLCYALLHFAGIANIELREPDLAIAAGEIRMGFAAKRVSTDKPGALTKRVRECLRQCDAHAQRGMALLNFASPSLDFAPHPASLLDGVEAHLQRDLSRIDHRKLLIGYLLYSIAILWARGGRNDQVARVDVQLRTFITPVDTADVGGLADWLSARGRQLRDRLVAEAP